MVILISGIAALIILGLGVCLWRMRRKTRLYQAVNHRLCRKLHDACGSRDGVRRDAMLRSAVFASTSHEIRTPLNGILSMITVLQETALSTDQRTYTEVMRESCCELLAMLNDVLDMARISAGKLDLESIAFDLGLLAERACLLMQPRAGEKGLQLEVSVADAVRGSYLGDPGRIRQLLYNLIGNAIKFTDEGSVRLSVSDGGEDCLRFEVSDTGCGIAPEARKLLFQQFSQLAPSVSRTHGGSGLGLSICKYLIERMGGEIGCESTPGHGSRFWFTLPLSRCAPVPLPFPGKELPKVTGGPHRVVLLAEDNRAGRLYTRALLTGMGHTVHDVGNGRDAVDAVRDGDFDCVLMDVQMPVMDGFSACRAIRALPGPAGRVAILGLSAEDGSDTRRDARAAGMTCFLRKPVDKALLGDWLVSLSSELPEPVLSTVVPVSTPVLDFHQLEELEAALPASSMVDLISMFLSDAAKFLHGIEAARQAGDLSAAGRLAHQLVSMSGNLGAMELCMQARRFERACQDGDAHSAEILARALSSASAKATATLAARHKYAPAAKAQVGA